jgi:alpha-L-fucosidase 2
MGIWFDKPAEKWEEALPIGNGRLGGMIFGTVHTERIQLNEDSVWYGGPMNRNNPHSIKYLSKIRSLILDGQVEEAEKLSTSTMVGVPDGQRHYEPLGDLFFTFLHSESNTEAYRRELNLEEGLVSLCYQQGNKTFKREYFSSYPDQVMVCRLESEGDDASFSFFLQFGRGAVKEEVSHGADGALKRVPGFHSNLDSISVEENDVLHINGSTGGKGISFSCGIKVIADGGDVNILGSEIQVENARNATIILASSTTYRDKNPKTTCVERVNNASEKGYQTLRSTHIFDYQRLFKRVDFKISNMSSKKLDHLPTNEKLKRLQNGEEDLELISTYFQFGRYLLISCSRPGSLAANLQGIWNKDMNPIWDSKYTININTQMNYWPAEVCNLSECHEPLFDLIEDLRINGQKTAKEMYGCRGFVAHHNTDIWGDTAPQDICLTSTFWMMSVPWLCLHFWEHYQYTLDKNFLSKSYETMREAAQFLLDFLIEDENGNLVTCPSLSPENQYRTYEGKVAALCAGPTMDNQIIHAFCTSFLKSSAILGIDDDFVEKIKLLNERVPNTRIGKYGQIMEWAVDYEEVDPGHRHISHLFGLYPGDQITVKETPELAEAAKVTLKRRLSNGGGHTGWSRAWIINMWARLKESEKAYDNVIGMLRTSTLPNLFDNHPPFQIDGNFGGTAGIAEMLLHSHSEVIELLPALPQAWENGEISGICARGGFEISIKWNKGVLSEVEVYVTGDNDLNLSYKNKYISVKTKPGQRYKFDGNLKVV